ncbi:protein phosphatase, putative [Plasmodium reichenowi]|uniref:Protein phosphatase, putative n=1 Tax=Plasmodium reichenowi TaxID=5854 RepID=A0A151LSC8_PLARE|nr:protein phosphatase, putative [Plasmodium reichenowi]KYO02084.1 protein phosphatase, putative [Plasmodium reichenowi]
MSMRTSESSNNIYCKNECSKYVYGKLYELIKDLNNYNVQCYINNEKKINLYEDFKYKKKKKIEFMSIVDYYGGLKNNEYEFFIIPIIFNKHNEILYMGVSIFFKNKFFEEYKTNNYNYIELFIYNVKNEETNNNFYPHMDIIQEKKKNTFLNFLINLDDLNKHHRQTNNHIEKKNTCSDKNIYNNDDDDVYNVCTKKNLYSYDNIINVCNEQICDKKICDEHIYDNDKINKLVPNTNSTCTHNISNYLHNEKISGDYKKIQLPIKIDDHYILCSDGVVKLKNEENAEFINDTKKKSISSMYQTFTYSNTTIQGTTRKSGIEKNNNDNIYKGLVTTDNHHVVRKEETINKYQNYNYSYTKNELNRVYENVRNKENDKKDDGSCGPSLVKYNEEIYHANISIQRKEMTVGRLEEKKMGDISGGVNKSINVDDNKKNNVDGNKKNNVDDNKKNNVDGNINDHVDGNQNDHVDGNQNDHVDGNQNDHVDDNKKNNVTNSVNTYCSYKYSASCAKEKVECKNYLSEDIKIRSPPQKKDEENVKINNMFKCGSYSFKGNRTYNEDRVIIIEDMNNFLKEEYDILTKKEKNEYELIDEEYLNIINNIKDMETPSYIYCAIYDGHNGDNAVNIVQKLLHIHMYYYFINGNGLENSLKYSFEETDNYLCKNIINIKEENHSNYSSGTTACVSVIFKNMLYVANIGDSRCIISKNGRAIVLTVDHRASINKKEEDRILKSGGILDDEGYLGGCLGVCRGFGSFHKKTKEKLKGLICEPDIFHIKLTDDDEFLIICCDGIFDVITSQEAVNTVKNSLIQSRDANTAAQALCQLAYKKKSLDNLSVLVVIFQNPDKNNKVSSINESSGIYSGQAGRVRRRIKFSALKDLINQ